MAARDYMYGWGRFFKLSSGKTKSFGVSLHQIQDFILENAHAKGEPSENSVARDLAGARSDMVSGNFGNFHGK